MVGVAPVKIVAVPDFCPTVAKVVSPSLLFHVMVSSGTFIVKLATRFESFATLIVRVYLVPDGVPLSTPSLQPLKTKPATVSTFMVAVDA